MSKNNLKGQQENALNAMGAVYQTLENIFGHEIIAGNRPKQTLMLISLQSLRNGISKFNSEQKERLCTLIEQNQQVNSKFQDIMSQFERQSQIQQKSYEQIVILKDQQFQQLKMLETNLKQQHSKQMQDLLTIVQNQNQASFQMVEQLKQKQEHETQQLKKLIESNKENIGLQSQQSEASIKKYNSQLTELFNQNSSNMNQVVMNYSVEMNNIFGRFMTMQNQQNEQQQKFCGQLQDQYNELIVQQKKNEKNQQASISSIKQQNDQNYQSLTNEVRSIKNLFIDLIKLQNEYQEKREAQGKQENILKDNQKQISSLQLSEEKHSEYILIMKQLEDLNLKVNSINSQVSDKKMSLPIESSIGSKPIEQAFSDKDLCETSEIIFSEQINITKKQDDQSKINAKSQNNSNDKSHFGTEDTIQNNQNVLNSIHTPLSTSNVILSQEKLFSQNGTMTQKSSPQKQASQINEKQQQLNLSFQKNYQTQLNGLKEDLANLNTQMQNNNKIGQLTLLEVPLNRSMSEQIYSVDIKQCSESKAENAQESQNLNSKSKSQEDLKKSSNINFKQKFQELQQQISDISEKYKVDTESNVVSQSKSQVQQQFLPTNQVIMTKSLNILNPNENHNDDFKSIWQQEKIAGSIGTLSQAIENDDESNSNQCQQKRFEFKEEILNKCLKVINVRYVEESGTLEYETITEIKQYILELCQDLYKQITLENRKNRRALLEKQQDSNLVICKDEQIYKNLLIQYITDVDMLLEQAQENICQVLNIQFTEVYQESCIVLTEQGHSQDILLLEAAIIQQLKDTLESNQTIQLSQMKNIIVSEINNIEQTPQFLTNILNAVMENEDQRDQTVQIYNLVLMDLVFLEYNVEEEDQIKSTQNLKQKFDVEILQMFEKLENSLQNQTQLINNQVETFS